MIFDATGQHLSTIMQKSLKLINISLSQIQFRFICQQSSGLIFSAYNQTDISVQDVKILGYSFNDNNENGYLASQLSGNTYIFIQHVLVCTNLPNQVGQQYILQLQLSQQPEENCINICSSLHLPAYGMCVLQLINGQLNDFNQTLSCVTPFIFDGKQCVCSHGYLLNESKCIQILTQLNNIELYILGNVTSINQHYSAILININSSIQQFIDQTYLQLVKVNSQIQDINLSIIQNQQYFVQSTNRIQQSIVQLSNEMMINNSIQNADIASLYATQDNIKADITIIKNTLANMNVSGSSNNSEDREYTCSIQGLTYKNGRCVCPLLGQVLYNGACKCAAYYFYNIDTNKPGICTNLQQCCQLYLGNGQFQCADKQWYNVDRCGFVD
ncbi:Hypothetical_protein [Hexamita inflata]|uniref:Hypothetical_protein n=1 Tax=Hexamita inflata TaxID=28002 RepID=A0AA86U8U1_9EUKA|nr:Hypothetical protein HINF_LOCUS35535 [Hexamita inflata]